MHPFQFLTSSCQGWPQSCSRIHPINWDIWGWSCFLACTCCISSLCGHGPSGIPPVTQGGCALVSWIFLQRHFVAGYCGQFCRYIHSSCGAKEFLCFPCFFLQLKEEKSFTVQSCSWRKMSYWLNKHRYSQCFLICWFSGLAAKLKFN